MDTEYRRHAGIAGRDYPFRAAVLRGQSAEHRVMRMGRDGSKQADSGHFVQHVLLATASDTRRH